MSFLYDMRGQTFGLMTIAPDAVPVRKRGNTHIFWPCLCECGREKLVDGVRLRSGRTFSCGCWRASPELRRVARLLTPAERRKEIAHLGGLARKTK